MKLFLLKAREDLPHNDDPFFRHWDMLHGIVVCADNEDEARKMADSQGYGEKSDTDDVWINSKYTTCEELLPANKGVILSNVIYG